MFGQIMRVALAFVGIIVGAGFASGQEVMQYFVGFGLNGLWGVALSALIMTVMAMIIVQLGSYFQAREHGEVFDRVSHKTFSRLLDIGVIITLFSTGFVMFAGAGSNLEQQWGLPSTVGAVIMVILVLAAGLLDVDRVTAVIGAITPFILGFLVLACLYVVFFVDTAPVAQLNASAMAVGSTLPNFVVSAINYVGFNLMVAVSMAIVIGGAMFNPRVAGYGGVLGGVIYSAMLVISALALFLAVEVVGTDDMPMLSIVNQIHPVAGHIMGVVVFGMIFNTALGMFYALAKRISAWWGSHFYLIYCITVIVGFGMSFFGFRTLVGYVYPVLGYMGIVLIVVMLIAWVRGRRRIAEEADRRFRLQELWNSGRSSEIDEESKASNLSDEAIREGLGR